LYEPIPLEDDSPHEVVVNAVTKIPTTTTMRFMTNIMDHECTGASSMFAPPRPLPFITPRSGTKTAPAVTGAVTSNRRCYSPIAVAFTRAASWLTFHAVRMTSST